MKFSCRLLASFVVVFAPLLFADTEPGITRTEPLPGNDSIFRMVGGGDVLVADRARTRLSNGTWVDNCFTTGIFDYEGGVFHGWRRNANFKFVIQTSPDGVTWTDVGSGKEFDGISTATYDAGKYLVAYTRHNRDQIIVSTDNGVTWTETNDVIKPAGINGDRFASGYAFGRWFLRGGSSTNAGFLTSTNGTTWTAVTVPAGTPTGGFSDVGMCFGGGVGLVSVANSLLRTTDGVNWTEAKRFSNGLQVNGIAFNNGSFLLGRTDFSQKFMLESSSDLGATFSIIPNVHQNRLAFIANLTQVKAVTAWKTGFAVAGENGFVLGTEDVSLGEPSFQRLTDASLYHFSSYPYQVVSNGGTLVRYFTGGTPRRVQTSVDGGFTWSTGVTDLTGATGSPKLLALGGKYFLRDVRGVSVSSDAITWTKAESTDRNPAQTSTTLWALSMAYDGARYLAIIEEFTNPGITKFLTASNDGVSWTKTGTVPVGGSTGNERLLVVGDEYFYVSTDFANISIHRSTNLTNWSLLVPPYPGFDTSPVRIYRNGNRWLVQGLGANRVSDDGVTFYNVPNGVTMPIGDVIEFNGKFYAPGNNSMLVSDDIHFWSETATPTSLQTLLTGNANGLLLVGDYAGPRYVDDLPLSLPPEIYAGPPLVITPGSNGKLKVSVQTEVNKYYYIETNPKLNLPLWAYDFANFPSIAGDGTLKEIEFTPSTPSGFFRMRVF